MKIQGYKSFNADFTNINGKKFTQGVTYKISGTPIFGPNGNGFHFAKRFEDTIRYSDYSDNKILRDVVIAQVIGSGEIAEGCDEYNGYYDLFSATELTVIKYLTREEIINMARDLPIFRLERFISLYRLDEEEISLFEGIDSSLDTYIDYYQRGNKDAFVEKNKQYIKLCYNNNR